MVHGTPWRLRRGILLAFTILCAHQPLQAQSLFGEFGDALFGNSSEPTATAPVTTGALQTNQQRTRFVIGLPKTTEFQVFSLSNPNRVVVQVAETKLRLPEQPKTAPIGLIKSFQAGLSGTDRSSVIIYVTEPVIVSSARIEKAKDGRNQHLVVEISSFVPLTASLAPPVKQHQKTTMAPPPFALGGADLQPPLPRPAVSPDVLAQRAFKPIIVIDPGHGGHDFGAMKNGAVEKDITLAFSKILAKKLTATGRFKVILTRDEDVFIPLGDRIAFGEKNKANLFIAVHCDYADTGSAANGATIYSLRNSTADSLRRSTRGDVGSNVLSQNEVEKVKQASEGEDVKLVKGILSDLAEREVDATHDRTNVFARTVIQTMGASTAMRNEPDQQAGFRVLKTAQFPSVLIELAYVTNKQDAANLQSDVWRDKVSNSILSAIDNYFSNQVAQLPM